MAEFTGIPVREKIDFKGLTMRGRKLPVVYVKSRIDRKSTNPDFSHLVREIEQQPQPGFVFTPEKTGDRFVEVRLRLNRHGIIHTDIFKGADGTLYRDIDAKGIGYVQGYPMRAFPISLPEMENDMEMRGICDYEFANDDWLNTDELTQLGVRVARNVAQVELFELVETIDREKRKVEIVPRQVVGKRLGVNFEAVRPMIHFRAMGTSSRVFDLPFVSNNPSYLEYVKEIVDDAISLVSLELGVKISPRDYVVWFTETLGRMLGLMHGRNFSPDFRKQIHSGTHNVTLDCRLLDTHLYDTPEKIRRDTESAREHAIKHPEQAWLFNEHYVNTREKVIENNLKVEAVDRERALFIIKCLSRGVGLIYDLGGLQSDVKRRFGAAYGKSYIPIRERESI